MGARVTEAELAVGHAHEKVSEDGVIEDNDLREGLRDALQTVVTGVFDRAAAA